MDNKAQLYKVRDNDIGNAAGVLVEAFRSTRMWRSVLVDDQEYEQKAPLLFSIALKFGLKYGDVYAPSSALEGVAIWTPDRYGDMTAWRIFRSGALGLTVRVGMKIAKKMQPMDKVFPVDRKKNMKGKPHVHLFMLGVRKSCQKGGYGHLLLESFIAECNRTGRFGYLETESESLVEYYRKAGFELVRKTELPLLDVPVWEMMRPPEILHPVSR